MNWIQSIKSSSNDHETNFFEQQRHQKRLEQCQQGPSQRKEKTLSPYSLFGGENSPSYLSRGGVTLSERGRRQPVIFRSPNVEQNASSPSVSNSDGGCMYGGLSPMLLPKVSRSPIEEVTKKARKKAIFCRETPFMKPVPNVKLNGLPDVTVPETPESVLPIKRIRRNPWRREQILKDDEGIPEPFDTYEQDLRKFLPDVTDLLYEHKNTIYVHKDHLFTLLPTYMSSGAYHDQVRRNFEEHGRECRFRLGGGFFLTAEDELDAGKLVNHLHCVPVSQSVNLTRQTSIPKEVGSGKNLLEKLASVREQRSSSVESMPPSDLSSDVSGPRSGHHQGSTKKVEVGVQTTPELNSNRNKDGCVCEGSIHRILFDTIEVLNSQLKDKSERDKQVSSTLFRLLETHQTHDQYVLKSLILLSDLVRDLPAKLNAILGAAVDPSSLCEVGLTSQASDCENFSRVRERENLESKLKKARSA
ncbi:unnamed protein product [Notodromas monacha]|uniref:Uncharacterized protein n=1 Tax=Notodromas monacha TaxID=399045 RepID=A0A7R9GHG0_9CRUS|nr:unnamed protein product [Notodromas monacha]CAG0922748.1 unnamed protein product [Notodromas monacha]